MSKKIFIVLGFMIGIVGLTFSLWPSKKNIGYNLVSKKMSSNACNYINNLLEKVARRNSKDFIKEGSHLGKNNMRLCYMFLKNYKSTKADINSVRVSKQGNRYYLNIICNKNKKTKCYLKYNKSTNEWKFDGLNI